MFLKCNIFVYSLKVRLKVFFLKRYKLIPLYLIRLKSRYLKNCHQFLMLYITEHKDSRIFFVIQEQFVLIFPS